ncbi:FAD-dependent monooxygenase [Kineosporia sp. J2-2]|uniref:FAD-dependent monooxygenase n=1 Tax=Kineosporia corallincola TaxID=2835133 RepID=A0ABS5TEN2_9ACTN|nr:FAD-dependent oxidoreductase [Kineosporia corallincola]MBT0769510.1 FAD-dependent monooxygenase [Kineosporia corallincola]
MTVVRTILRMRAREGQENAFETAWKGAARRISLVPGCLGQQLLRDESDPRTFLVVADWVDRASVDAFGRSDLREHLTEALRDLREDASRSTFTLLESIEADDSRPVRVDVSTSVQPGEEADFERAYLTVADRVSGAPGHLREELLREPDGLRYHIFAEWESERQFLEWVEDPAHLKDAGPLARWLSVDFSRQIFQIRQRPVTARVVPDSPTATTTMVNDAEVLVVGAGPAGLTQAIELARRGIRVRVVDRREQPSGQADKAIGIHCRTMEVWERQGVVTQAIDAGTWLHGQTVYVNGRLTHQVDWAGLDELPYAHLGLPQYETERILTQRLNELGVQVERGVSLISMTQDEEGVTARLSNGTARVRYLVGCDGAHSAVREQLGLTFEGGLSMFPQLFMLADVDLDWEMPAGHLLRFVRIEEDGDFTGMLVCVPLKGKNRYRVATLAPEHYQQAVGTGVVPAGFSQEYDPPALADVQGVLDELAPSATTASNLRWASIFRIKHGIVDRYREGRVFVAGDAAHLHPPAGGQGMNTGIQDAWNLGWKLALVLRGQARPALLDSYDTERRPAGRAIVDRAVNLAFTDEMDMEDQKAQFLLEMQMTMNYAGSPLVGERLGEGVDASAGPLPGHRAPDVTELRRFGVAHPLRLFDVLNDARATLLLWTDEAADLDAVAEMARGATSGQVNVCAIVSGDLPGLPGQELPVYQDCDGHFAKTYAVSGPAAYLVRPDGHVGFRTLPLSAPALHEHLTAVYG